ncbi:MAG: Cys-Gln thioester bond-forming surface protein [Bacilli bacterium]|nr:Cys-Gln thioester bond-forming surface protein [Bacilli bacterium]
MKKRTIFLILLSAILLLQGKNVYAQETRFYEAEYISGIYLNKSPGTDHNTVYYQTARFFREKNTDKFAYCIEPQRFFEESASYNYWQGYRDFTKDQIERIKALSHFGYQYKDHTDKKWYAITQYLIWKEADPDGLYFFSDSLGGNEKNLFQSEINELNTMVNDYLKRPNLPSITLEQDSISLSDKNQVLKNYQTSLGRIENNNLILENIEEGEYDIALTRKDNYFNEPFIFYQSNYSQDLINYGDFEIKTNIHLKVIGTSITIQKIDAGTQQFESALQNTKYELLNEQKEVIDTLTVDENGIIQKKRLPYGKYYIKEKETSPSYQLDLEEHEITISEENPKVEITLENKIIEKKIKIHKTYGENDNFIGEENVIFEIYQEDTLFGTYQTDESGTIELTLPFGEYRLVQVNTKEGYRKLEPIDLLVLDDEEVTYELKDYKIPVPNTHIDWSILDILVELFKWLSRL